MNLLRVRWKEILIIIFALLFISNCNGKGNYKRKYNKQIAKTEYVSDSIKNVVNNCISAIDSLKNEISLKDNEISSLKKEISIYKDQNTKLANKPVIVKVQKEDKP